MIIGLFWADVCTVGITCKPKWFDWVRAGKVTISTRERTRCHDSVRRTRMEGIGADSRQQVSFYWLPLYGVVLVRGFLPLSLFPFPIPASSLTPLL